jgi:hypothetical protein
MVLTAEQVKKIYSLTGAYCGTFEDLVNLLLKAKKEGVKFSVENLSDLISDKKAVNKIVDALVNAKKEGINLEIEDIQNVFYSDFDKDKMLKMLILIKQEKINLNVHQLKVAFLKNIDIKKLGNVMKMLKDRNLEIPFSKLTDLLSKNLNITKCIDILTDSKNAAAEELFKLGLFKHTEVQMLANVYAVEGKERFKKKLSDTILEKGFSEDPTKIYFRLQHSVGNAFKINLEHIIKYISYDFEPDIDEINRTYIKARNNNLQINYEQLVKLAEKKVKISEFVDAQIKSGANE